MKKQIKEIVNKYKILIVYSFGSNAVKVRDFVLSNKQQISFIDTDIDIGIKSSKNLSLSDKILLTQSFEELFNVNKVDLIDLSKSSIFFTFQVICGELIYCKDAYYEAEYQLYIMQRVSELLPFERAREKQILVLRNDKGKNK